MDFSTLQTDVFARGFQRLNDAGAGLARVKRWINAAYDEICEQADWPFLEASAAGAAPLTVADLRTIESVVVTTTGEKLYPRRRQLLQDEGVLLTDAGSPQYYYVTGGTVVSVYPLNTGSITVKYWKTPADLSTGADLPLIPVRFHDLIVEAAAMKAHRYQGDYEGAAACSQEYQRLLAIMWNSLLDQQHDQPEYAQFDPLNHSDA